MRAPSASVPDTAWQISQASVLAKRQRYSDLRQPGISQFSDIYIRER